MGSNLRRPQQDAPADVAGPHDPLEEARLVAALTMARRAYAADHVRLGNRALGGRETLVASRQGVFAVSHGDHVPIVYGLFYGATIHEGDIYLFESCDAPSASSRRGRIVRLRRRGDAITGADILAKDLDNGCHQIDFIDGRLHVVDTYNQRILRFAADFASHEALYPLARVESREWAGGYVHCNSLLRVGDRVLLLLHNGGERQSEVAVFDRAWRELDRFALPGRACHNMAVLENGTILSCGSIAGELIGIDGPVARISPLMTRGLCVGEGEIAVGASVFTMRRYRNFAAGTVTFLDRRYRRLATLALPAAPTDIRRLDGTDRGRSACLERTALALRPGRPSC